MTSEQAVETMIDALIALDIRYMLTGSLASNLYGIERATRDADFVVEIQPEAVPTLGQRISPDLRIDPQLSFETITGTTRYIISVADNPFRIELFLLTDDPHNQARFQRRQRARTMNRDVWVPTAEDVIITKLRWSKQGRRHKDIDDARNVLAVQWGRLDRAYIERWCRQHGTWDMFVELEQSLEGIV